MDLPQRMMIGYDRHSFPTSWIMLDHNFRSTPNEQFIQGGAPKL